MHSRLTIYLLTAVILTNCCSCQTSTEQQDTTKLGAEDFFQLVLQLDEFKQEQKRVDSINKVSSIPVEVTVSIIDSSFLAEDKGKNISLGFIADKYPFEERIMYTIKFDKDKKKIIGVTKDKKQFEKTDFAAPEDLPLPSKQ